MKCTRFWYQEASRTTFNNSVLTLSCPN